MFSELVAALYQTQRLASPTPQALASLVRWLELVVEWNRRIDLTAAKGDEALVELAILDAAHLAEMVPDDAGSVVDVGPGFGAPGLALALLRPNIAMTLVEPLGKRVAFLRAVAGALRLGTRVTVRQERGEQTAAHGLRFDVAISRATLAPTAWLALGHELAPTGLVHVLLAREPDPQHAERNVACVREYATRDGAPRRIVSFARNR